MANSCEPGENGRLPAPSSPTDSVAKAMKNDLEELIGYIDNLAFEQKNEKPPVPKSMGTPSTNKELFPTSSGSVLQDRTNKFISNGLQNNTMGKLKDSDAETVKSPARYIDSSINLSSVRARREEPAGSPPTQEPSLYFHEDSFSLNLSQSQEVDESNISEPERNPSGRSPRLLSTLQRSGVVESPEVAKTIGFTLLSKDPTPSKPLRSPRDRQNNFATPSKAFVSNEEEKESRRKSLASRQATPFLRKQVGEVDRLEQENLDRKGNEWWRARPALLDSETKENGEGKSLKFAEKFSTPVPKPRYSIGTPFPSQTRNEEASDGIENTGVETPGPRSSNLVLTSPESAKKLLRSAMEALQDARKERDEARQWADDIKKSVNEWVEDQRRLMRTESSSLADHSNAVPAALFEQKHQAVESLIEDLRNELKSSQSDTEAHLHAIVQKQDEKIRELALQLTSVKEQLAHMIMKKEKSKIARAQSVIAQQPAKAQTTPFRDTTKLVRSASRSEASHSSQRTRRATPSGGHLIDYGNGVTKELHPDGTTVTRFKNGDVETRFPNTSTTSNPAATCMVAYYHCKEEVLQITQRDGSVLYEYSNGQVERHCADGVKIVLFPDGTKTML